MCRLFILFFVFALYSCTANDRLIDNLPVEEEAIADKIANYQLFIDLGDRAKKLNSLMLSDLLDNAKSLNQDEALELEQSEDRAEFLKARNFKKSEEISRVSAELKTIGDQLRLELEQVQAKIGDEKYRTVGSIIDQKYSHLFKLSSAEGLRIADQTKNK